MQTPWAPAVSHCQPCSEPGACGSVRLADVCPENEPRNPGSRHAELVPLGRRARRQAGGQRLSRAASLLPLEPAAAAAVAARASALAWLLAARGGGVAGLIHHAAIRVETRSMAAEFPSFVIPCARLIALLFLWAY